MTDPEIDEERKAAIVAEFKQLLDAGQATEEAAGILQTKFNVSKEQLYQLVGHLEHEQKDPDADPQPGD